MTTQQQTVSDDNTEPITFSESMAEVLVGHMKFSALLLVPLLAVSGVLFALNIEYWRLSVLLSVLVVGTLCINILFGGIMIGANKIIPVNPIHLIEEYPKQIINGIRATYVLIEIVMTGFLVAWVVQDWNILIELPSGSQISLFWAFAIGWLAATVSVAYLLYNGIDAYEPSD